MKRFFILVLAITLSFSAASAFAASPQGLYVGGKVAISRILVGDIDWIGGAKSDGDFTSFGIGALVGYDWAETQGLPLRLEGELMFRTGEEWKKSGAGWSGKFEITSITTIFANCWFDIVKIQTGQMVIKPFAGVSAGLGLASYDRKLTVGGASAKKDGFETAFYFGPGAGVRLDINDKIAVDTMLRYLFSTKYDFSGDKYDAPTMELNVGIAYKF